MKQKKLITIAQKTNGRCFYCNSKDAHSIDHFFPNQLFKEWELKDYLGTNNNLENLFLCCRSCNSSKGAKHPEDYMGRWVAWDRYFRANKRVGLLSDNIKKIFYEQA